jgi:putative ABC transport system permease protein
MMAGIRHFYRRLRALWRSEEIRKEITEEMRFHIELRAEENLRQGMSPADARRAAERLFGPMERIRDEGYDVRGGRWLEAIWRDLRYGLRVMKRRPGFAATVIGTLALGIGVTVAVFSVIDATLIRSLPYHEADRLIAVREARMSEGGRESGVAPGRLEDWNRLTESFEGLAGAYVDTLTETSGSSPERLTGAFVSPRFFPVFRASAATGRMFTVEEEQFGGPAVVVISHGFWRRRFASDPGVVGRTLSLSGQSYTIVGVAPPSFQYPTTSTELWAPKQARPQLMQIRAARFYRYCVGRLKSSATLDQARSDLVAVQVRLGEQYPKTDAGWTVRVESLKESQVGKLRLALWLLFGSAAVLLMIACANVAGLLLTQFSARAEEVAIRRALGASRVAIARQLFAEGFAYAAAGAAAGVMFAFAAAAVIRRQLPELPRITELSVDLRVLVFAAAIGAAVAALVSLAPMIQTLRRNESLLLSGRGVIGRGRWLPRTLVSAQLALATVLLVGSGLFLTSLLRLQENDLGFRPEQVLAFHIGASFNEPPDAVVKRHGRTLDALSSLPDVQSVAMANGLPATVSGAPVEFRIVGQENSADAVNRFAAERAVTAGYFKTLGVPIFNGQSCRMDPDPKNGFEALVNRAFVDRFLQGREAVGLTVVHGPPASARTMQIVGVVGDTREAGYANDPGPTIFACGYLRFWPDSDFLIQTRGAPETMIRAVRETIGAIEPERAVYVVSPLSDALSGTLSQNRFRAWLISAFSAVALLLAGVGLYGVTAYMVAQRFREFGLRLALGAQSAQIWTEILASGARLACVGVGVGAVLAFLASQLIETLLYGVRGFDVVSYLYAAAILFITAMLACLVPGRRAASVDPARALREQ